MPTRPVEIKAARSSFLRICPLDAILWGLVVNPEPRNQPKCRNGGGIGQTSTIMGIPEKVVFCVVFVLVFLLLACFVGGSYVELRDILKPLRDTNSREEALKELKEITTDMQNTQEKLRAHLEFSTIQNRKERANYFIATRTWLRFMASTFGSILAFIGAIFLLSRIVSESRNMIIGEGGGLRLMLITTSPGIVMIVVGAVLMTIPHFSDQPITTKDAATYILLSEKEPAEKSSNKFRNSIFIDNPSFHFSLKPWEGN